MDDETSARGSGALVKAGESQTIVHEATLDASVVEEPFVKEGQGSAFESRPHVLVVLRTTERGLGLLRRKVEQLINRGFHHVAVDLSGVDKLAGPDEAWLGVRQAAQYAEQWTAWLPVAGAAAGVKAALEAASKRDGKLQATFLGSRDAVLAAFRAREQEEAGEEPQPLEVGSSDLTTSSEEAADPNDWGWGSQDTTAEEEAPKLDVAELLVEADELPGLRDRVEQIVRKGKKYLTLRLHFKRDRRMADGDLATLVAVRDRMAKAGGQLVLASLQEDVLKWLKLLDEDRHFVITDTADAAEKAHGRHASGEAPAPAAAPAGPPLAIAESKVDASGRGTITVRSAKGGKSERVPVRVVVLGKEGLPHLGTRVKRLAGDQLRDVIADLGRFKDIRGERFDAIPAALEQARKAGVRVAFANVSREVKALLKILGVVEGAQDASALAESLDAAALHLALARHATSPVGELVLDLSREELVAAPAAEPISSIELSSEEPVAAPAARAAAAPGVSGAELQAAKAEAQRLQAELQAARKRAEDAARERDALKAKAPEADAAARRAAEAQKKADEAQKKADEAAAQAAQARSAEAAARAEAAKLKERLAQVEQGAKTSAAQQMASHAALTDLTTRAQAAETRAADLERRLTEKEAATARLGDVERRLAEQSAAAAKVTDLEKRLAEKEQALSSTTSQQSEQKSKTLRLEQAVLEKDKRLGGLEADAKKAAERIRTLEAELQAAKAKAGGGKDAGALERRVAELEHEKARILTEAEQEIARLTKEQQLLKEELDSAGEMIERLGKELEFS